MNWNFTPLKWRYRTILKGYSLTWPLHRPGRYLQIRFLNWPLKKGIQHDSTNWFHFSLPFFSIRVQKPPISLHQLLRQEIRPAAFFCRGAFWETWLRGTLEEKDGKLALGPWENPVDVRGCSSLNQFCHDNIHLDVPMRWKNLLGGSSHES